MRLLVDFGVDFGYWRFFIFSFLERMFCLYFYIRSCVKNIILRDKGVESIWVEYTIEYV